jgi:3-oxoacyl-[acyl-carrier protein] reductase
VAFGFIQTRMTQAITADTSLIDVGGRMVPGGMPESVIRDVESRIPLGRAGTAEDAANAVYLFCAPEYDYITGQLLQCGRGLIV